LRLGDPRLERRGRARRCHQDHLCRTTLGGRPSHESKAIKDPGAVVIDEIVGQWVVLLGLPLDPLRTSLPSSCFGYSTFGNRGQYAGRTVTLDGGLGVMLDDLLAGVYAACALSVLLATGGALGVRS
jgi:hypothetical protein